jgi:hypothetical protein
VLTAAFGFMFHSRTVSADFVRKQALKKRRYVKTEKLIPKMCISRNDFLLVNDKPVCVLQGITSAHERL